MTSQGLDDLVERDLAELRKQPGYAPQNEAGTRSLLRERHRLALLAEQAGTTVEYIRRAEAEESQRRAAHRSEEEMDRARSVVLGDEIPKGPTNLCLQKRGVIEREARRMARDSGKWTYVALSVKAEVRRETIADWHRKGWLRLP
jgi:hypothetical protein